MRRNEEAWLHGDPGSTTRLPAPASARAPNSGPATLTETCVLRGFGAQTRGSPWICIRHTQDPSPPQTFGSHRDGGPEGVSGTNAKAVPSPAFSPGFRQQTTTKTITTTTVQSWKRVPNPQIQIPHLNTPAWPIPLQVLRFPGKFSAPPETSLQISSFYAGKWWPRRRNWVLVKTLRICRT